MTVINIDEYRPHLSGEIKCIICGHQWVGVCMVDQDGNVPCFECPKCGLHQGFFTYPILPNDCEVIYRCDCSGELFYISDRGARCIRCGALHEDI